MTTIMAPNCRRARLQDAPDGVVAAEAAKHHGEQRRADEDQEHHGGQLGRSNR
jgi:hypothetical protein